MLIDEILAVPEGELFTTQISPLKTKEILFVEYKWQDRVNVEKVSRGLEEKAGFVDRKKRGREECYTIFAKSFRKKIEEKNVLLFDLKDLEDLRCAKLRA
jgi:hypothetical protein